MTKNKNIFDFAEVFDIKSPFPDWISENASKKEELDTKYLSVIKVEGPFNEKGEILRYISRNHEYYYLASLNKNITTNNVEKIKWAVSYDDDNAEKSFYLFSGGVIYQNKIKIKLQSTLGKKKFKVYAYTGNVPVNTISVEVKFKNSVAFFIGGAGDSKKYFGQGPSFIVRDEVAIPFSSIAPIQDYSYKYLGFEDIYKNDKIKKNVLPLIESKEGTAIYIVGHSLGGWNGAHLSQILSDKGYSIEMLLTLDPVGTKVGVTLISDIYWDTPKPKSNYWVNIYANPDSNEIDDYIAWGGGQWIPNKNSVDVFHEVKYHHRQAGKMFKEIVKDGNSSSDILLSTVEKFLQEK